MSEMPSQRAPKAAPLSVTILMLVFGVLIGLPMTLILWLKRGFFTDPAADIASGATVATLELVPAMQTVLLGAWGFGFGFLLYGLFRLLTGRRLPWVKVVLLMPGAAMLYGLYLFAQSAG